MLLALVMVGKYVETGVRNRTSDALTLLYGLLPRKALLLQHGVERQVAVGQIAVGDVVLVRPGERIPADGIVVSGNAAVDESLLSGEPRPATKAPNDRVTGGTIPEDGALYIRVDKIGEATTLSKIIALVEDALRRKTPAEQTADKISRVFVPAIIFVALATAAWLLVFAHAGYPAAIARLVAVLVIACPCALGIATPMAMSTSMGIAAKQGVLIGDGGVFEALVKARSFVFDKTGTVTLGRFSVHEVWPAGVDLAGLAALETQSEHAIGRAILAHFAATTAMQEVVAFERVPGMGLRGVVDTRCMFAGNVRLAMASGAHLSADIQARARTMQHHGWTVVYFGSRDVVDGIVALGDAPRPGAAEAISELVRRGVVIHLLSGDEQDTVRTVAQIVGIGSWFARFLPSDKANWLRELRRRTQPGTVVMVGDGVNDAPALAEADVGIAVASGTEIAARAAQITMISSDLRVLPGLIDLARSTTKIIRQNLFWAFLYNVVCIPLAVAGLVTPIWAVVAMLISSTTVVLNTQRLNRLNTPAKVSRPSG